MRVLVVASWFPDRDKPTFGSFVLEQVAALRRSGGVDARVLSSRVSPGGALEEKLDGVPVIRMSYRRGPLGPTHLAAAQRAVRHIAGRVHASFPFELVHAHTSYHDGTIGRMLARRFAVPFIVTEHTSGFDAAMRNPFVRRATRRVLAAADRVLAVSRALAARVAPHVPAERRAALSVLGNGVDTARFRPPRQWRPDPQRPRLVAVGALHEVKNPRVLIEAFAHVRQRIPGATLDIVGDGPEAPAVRRRLAALRLEGAVRLHGTNTRDQVAARLSDACDLLVSSSDEETFGLALVEALACGKPVVATRSGGPEDIVTEPWLGALCDPGDPRALAAAIIEVAARLPRFEPARIRAHALERFSLAHLTAELQRIYAQVLAARPTGGSPPASPSR